MTTQVIWSNFADKLLGFIKARVNSTENAEDILQDVFIKIHQGSHQLDDADKLTSWVYQITRNTIIDFHRKKKIPLTELVEMESREEDESSNPQFIRCLMPFVKELPEKYRDALEKTIYGDLSQKEYAASLNLSYSATKSRVHRARLMLKDLFVSCCDVKSDSYGNIISSKFGDCAC